MRNPELLESLEGVETLAEIEPNFHPAQTGRTKSALLQDQSKPKARSRSAQFSTSSLDTLPYAEPQEWTTEPAAPTADLDTLLDKQMPAPRQRSLAMRLARALAPLYGTFYDLQMQLGKGVRVVEHRLQVGQFPRGVPTLRAAYISDLHYGPTSGRVAARQAWKQAREAEPDVLFLGGDFLYGDERGLPALLRELQRWKRNPPRGGMYACLGNHDHEGNSEALITCLEACGVRVLVNEAVPLPSPWHDVWVVGTDDITMGDPQPELALAGVPVGACAIMLSHSPDICEYGAHKRCNLTLCGHTHGGQVSLPNGDSPYLPSKWGKHYPAGLFRHAGNWIFVSRGVGTVTVPVRLWAPPDVAILEIAGTVRSTTPAPLRPFVAGAKAHSTVSNEQAMTEQAATMQPVVMEVADDVLEHDVADHDGA